MKKLVFEIQNAPTNAPITITINVMDQLYSEVKLYTTKIDGKPAIISGKRWYVYFYFRHPETNKMTKFCYTEKINKIKDLKLRLQTGKAWVKAYTILLQNGFNPFLPDGIKIEASESNFDFKKYTTKEAIDYALENKAGELKQSTFEDYKTRVGVFIQWLEQNGIDKININDLKDVHIVGFMNYLTNPNGRNVGKTSQHNYKSCLSSIFGKLKKDKIIVSNIIDYDTTKDEPIKNKPFTPKEVKKIRDYLLENDKQLYYFISFIIYEFLREIEVIRLTCGDFDLNQKTLTVETKTSRSKTKKLITPILNYLNSINIESQPKKANLFTNTGEFYIWDAKEKSKVDHFANRFKKVRIALNFGPGYGIYSFRHSAALDLYHTFVKNGKTHTEAVSQLMPIIGHSNENTTEKYLRDIDALLPKDYGEFYTLEF